MFPEQFTGGVDEDGVHAQIDERSTGPNLVNIHQNIANTESNQPEAAGHKAEGCGPQVLVNWNWSFELRKSTQAPYVHNNNTVINTVSDQSNQSTTYPQGRVEPLTKYPISAAYHGVSCSAI
jgi:hypothetical protein